MPSTPRLAGISIDAADLATLADFYRDLLDLQVMIESDDFIALSGAAVLLTVQRVDDYRRPEWPTGTVPKQLHLELAVDDLDAAQERVLALGGTVASSQPSPEHWRVLIDPAGHPFCITTLVPDT